MGDIPYLSPAPRAPLLQRLTPRQLLWVDISVSGLLFILCFWQLRHLGPTQNAGLQALCLLVVALAVAIRRRFTDVSLGAITVALTVSAAAGGSFAAAVLIAFPMFQMASTRARQLSVVWLLGSASMLLLGTAIGEARFHPVAGAGFAVVIAVAAWFVGDSTRARRAYVAGLAEQAAERQRQTAERAQRSVAEERLRIARELHDVVAHSLSVIAVQSGVGRHVIDDNPEAAKQALGAVETTSRAALQELRRLLGVLRAEGDAPELVPAPGLSGLDQLAAQVRAAGVQVELQIDAFDSQLSPGAELSVYRVVQEALTNVVKHAGPASVQVAVRQEAQEVTVSVLDNGCGPVPALYQAGGPDISGHHGIIGMRERVALFGGTIQAGFRPEGGFAVSARLPRDAVLT